MVTSACPLEVLYFGGRLASLVTPHLARVAAFCFRGREKQGERRREGGAGNEGGRRGSKEKQSKSKAKAKQSKAKQACAMRPVLL